MEKGKEGSDNLYKKSLNGMLGPGDVDYDEEGFVIERGKEDMRRREEFARENPWLEAIPGDKWLGEFGEPRGAIPLQMYD